MKSPRFDPCQLLSSFDGRKKLEQPINAIDACQYGIVASCNPTQVGSQTSGLITEWSSILYGKFKVHTSNSLK
jgi:hypothetical protein